MMLAPFLVGARRLLSDAGLDGALPVVWVVIFPALAYAPHNLQRRLPDGVWVALVAVAVLGLSTWAAESRRRRRMAVGLMVLSLPSAVLLLMGGVLVAVRPSEPVFRPVEEVRAFEWLQTEGEPWAVVMAAFETGNALPAWAPQRVVIGHGPESVRLSELAPQVEAFYDLGWGDEARWTFLRVQGVRYVFHGPWERALGAWDPSLDAGLQLRYDSGEYRIYEVSAGPAAVNRWR